MSTVLLTRPNLSDLSSRSAAEGSACVPAPSSNAGLGQQADPSVSLRDDRLRGNVLEEKLEAVVLT